MGKHKEVKSCEEERKKLIGLEIIFEKKNKKKTKKQGLI